MKRVLWLMLLIWVLAWSAHAQTISGGGGGAGGSGLGSSKDMSIDAPSTVDSNKYHIASSTAVTINRISCSTDQGTVTINWDVRAEATPNTPGTNVLSAGLVCGSPTATTCASGCGVNTITNGSVPAHAPVNLQITAVSVGPTPNIVRIHVEAQ